MLTNHAGRHELNERHVLIAVTYRVELQFDVDTPLTMISNS
jgi:hypothetical protein